MSTATDLNDSEMELGLAETVTPISSSEAHSTALAVAESKLYPTENWTGESEPPSSPTKTEREVSAKGIPAIPRAENKC